MSAYDLRTTVFCHITRPPSPGIAGLKLRLYVGHIGTLGPPSRVCREEGFG